MLMSSVDQIQKRCDYRGDRRSVYRGRLTAPLVFEEELFAKQALARVWGICSWKGHISSDNVGERYTHLKEDLKSRFIWEDAVNHGIDIQVLRTNLQYWTCTWGQRP